MAENATGDVTEEMSVDSGVGTMTSIASSESNSGTLTPADGESRSERGASESEFSHRQEMSSVLSDRSFGTKGRESTQMDVVVKTIDNKENTFELCQDNTVQDVYNKVAEWLGRTVTDTHLLYKGEKLICDAKKTLKDCGMTRGSNLVHSVNHFRGGW